MQTAARSHEQSVWRYVIKQLPCLSYYSVLSYVTVYFDTNIMFLDIIHRLVFI
jgi:hypothetical protein